MRHLHAAPLARRSACVPWRHDRVCGRGGGLHQLAGRPRQRHGRRARRPQPHKPGRHLQARAGGAAGRRGPQGGGHGCGQPGRRARACAQRSHAARDGARARATRVQVRVCVCFAFVFVRRGAGEGGGGGQGWAGRQRDSTHGARRANWARHQARISAVLPRRVPPLHIITTRTGTSRYCCRRATRSLSAWRLPTAPRLSASPLCAAQTTSSRWGAGVCVCGCCAWRGRHALHDALLLERRHTPSLALTWTAAAHAALPP